MYYYYCSYIFILPDYQAERLNGRMRRVLEHRKRLEAETDHLRKTQAHNEFKPKSEPVGICTF